MIPPEHKECWKLFFIMVLLNLLFLTGLAFWRVGSRKVFAVCEDQLARIIVGKGKGKAGKGKQRQDIIDIDTSNEDGASLKKSKSYLL